MKIWMSLRNCKDHSLYLQIKRNGKKNQVRTPNPFRVERAQAPQIPAQQPSQRSFQEAEV